MLKVTKGLRWVAALLLTWLLSATILTSLLARLGAESIAFALVLDMVLPLWILGFFAIADPDIDHPWLEPSSGPDAGSRAAGGT